MQLRNILAAAPDPARVLESIRLLPAQAIHALADAHHVELPRRAFDRVVVAGMGGSGLGAHVVASAFAPRLRYPVDLVADYALPATVTRRTLVILSSYSGNTEETLAAYDAARARGCSVATITTGGTLADRARRDRIPYYRVDPVHNPSMQPRYGVGYMTFGTLVFLRAARCIAVTNDELHGAVAALRAAATRAERSTALPKLARTLATRIPLYIAAEHLAGALHVVQNQTHESAKHVAASFLLPELNHHLLEGLRFPTTNPRHLHAILFTSRRYHPRNVRRVAITRALITRQRIPTTIVPVHGDTPFTEALDTLTWGAYLTYTLAVTHRINPGPVPYVDALKRRLVR